MVKRTWYITHCPLYSRCPLFGVSLKEVLLYRIQEGDFSCRKSRCIFFYKVTDP